jgi:phosphoribosyl-ATP pyrophosphohydrolase/phosphoribosyl-AMP cyclohydrolase
VDFSKGGGTVTVVAQDVASGVVLMVAHADRAALEKTIDSGEMHYHSRTRGAWHKGATSGNTQRVVSLSVDCDNDTVLALVEPRGPACHTGAYSCFGTAAPRRDAFAILDQTIAQRASALNNQPVAQPLPAASEHPSYTQRLLRDRNLRLKKIGEEAAELIAACADGNVAMVVDEAADLVYHIAVALNASGASLEHVRQTLEKRQSQ